MGEMGQASVDAVVTDPPYELGFMGKSWDATGVAYKVEVWKECLRVLKPGGHLLAFGGSRTYHRLACAVEDAGFEIRDQIMWVYGSGFPKSLDVSKAIDKMHGAERQVIGVGKGLVKGDGGRYNWNNGDGIGQSYAIDSVPATDDAKRWSGWGTALKPAHEPIVVARKPLEGTVAENVLKHGTGAINIDGCRVSFVSDEDRHESTAKNQHEDFGTKPTTRCTAAIQWYSMVQPSNYNPPGRWPANFIHDGSGEVMELFPWSTSGSMNGIYKNTIMANKAGIRDGNEIHLKQEASSGSAARFFYCAKASRGERDAGLEGKEIEYEHSGPRGHSLNGDGSPRRNAQPRANHHPTVKPIALMRYLVRLVTPPGGLVLDPFTGSGTTGLAALREGMAFVGCEQSEDYIKIATARLRAG
jgi:site-specific DNA-methyltransferase (adenine-specific)